MPGYLGLFVDSLAAKCELLVCFQHTPLPVELSQMDYRIKATNVRLVSIGPHTTVPLRIATALTRQQIFRDWHNKLDGMLVRAPTPLLPILASVWKKPIALLVVGDNSIGIENLPQPQWRKVLLRLWTKWDQAQLMRVAKHSLTFVNSNLLYKQHHPVTPNLIEIHTTTLNEHDFFYRTDTCRTPPYRLLYTGRMTRYKGLFEIVEALSSLVQAGFDVVLDLVGMVEKKDPILEELAQRAEALGVGNRVTYHGYKPAGPELLAYYRRADIYIVASQSSSEGFPRTIWEAMASSMPVVATEVGSIPAYIQGAALLIPPKQPQTLASAIQKLFADSAFRKSLIQKGMVLAQENTLERRGEEMINHIGEWLFVRRTEKNK